MVTSAAPAIFVGRFIFYVYGAHSADVLLQKRVFSSSVSRVSSGTLVGRPFLSSAIIVKNAVKARFLPSVSRSSTSTITTISMELLPT